MILNTNIIPRMGKTPQDSAGELQPDDARIYVPPLIIPTMEPRFPLRILDVGAGSAGGSIWFGDWLLQQNGAGTNTGKIGGVDIPAGYYRLQGDVTLTLTTLAPSANLSKSSVDVIYEGMVAQVPIIQFPGLGFSAALTTGGGVVPYMRQIDLWLAFETTWSLNVTLVGELGVITEMFGTFMLHRLL